MTMIVKPGFLTHPKTQLLCRLLNDRSAALYVIALWEHCEVSHSSELSVSDGMLSAICRYEGEPKLFRECLAQSGFIDHKKGKWVVHQWDEYNIGLLNSRKNGHLGGRPKKNPRDTHGIPTGNPRATHGQPTANLNETDRLDGLDREDRKEETPPLSPLGGTEELSLSSEPEKAKPETQWTESYGWQNIQQDKKARWKVAYPACDIDRHLAEMDAWLRANPARAHKSRWDAFIVNWLKRSQDRGGDCQSQRVGYGQQRRNTEPIDHSKGFWGDKK